MTAKVVANSIEDSYTCYFIVGSLIDGIFSSKITSIVSYR